MEAELFEGLIVGDAQPDFEDGGLMLLVQLLQHLRRSGVALLNHRDETRLNVHVLQRDCLPLSPGVAFQHESLHLSVHLRKPTLDESVNNGILNESFSPNII